MTAPTHGVWGSFPAGVCPCSPTLVTRPSPSPRRRSVKVIRLIGRDTVEEMVCGKAAAKLQLASTVVEGGHLTLGTQQPAAGLQVQQAVLHFRMCQVYSRWARKYRERADMTSHLASRTVVPWPGYLPWCPPHAEAGGAEDER